MKKLLEKFFKKKDREPAEKGKLTSDILKSVLSAFLSLCLLAAGTLAWFNAYKAPNTADLIIDDPTAQIRIDKFNPETEQYELFYNEPAGDGAGKVTVNIPEMMFYRWQNTVASTITEKLYYRITVTSRFSPAHFAKTPLFYIRPVFAVESADEELENVKIIKAEYLVHDPLSGTPPANTFPTAGYGIVPLDNGPDPLTSPNVSIVQVDGQNRFQSVLYLMIDSDNDAIAEIIDQLGASLVGYAAVNTITLTLGFRSVPYYTASTP